MPFLAPLIPALIGIGGTTGAAIGAGAGIGGTLLQNKLFGGNKNQNASASQSGYDPNDAEIKSLMAENMRTGAGWSKELMPYARQSLMDYRDQMSQPLRYWGGILSGNRQRQMEAIAPEASQISDIYDNTFRTNSELNPRGGSTVMNAALPYQKAGQISSLLGGLRSQAAGAVGDIAGTSGNMASNLFGSAMSGLGQSSQGGSSILNYSLGNRGMDLQKRGQNFDLASGVGSSIFSVIKWLMDRKKSGGGDSTGGWI